MTDLLTADPGLDLVLRRRIKASPATLWRCWTEPDLLKPWFMPKPHMITHCEIDLRPGGAFRTTMLIDGAEVANDGCYLEVIAQRRLVFTDTLTAGFRPSANPFFTAFILMEPAKDGGTHYTAIARHGRPETAKRHAEMGFHDGWGTVLTQLEAFALTLK